MTAKDDRDRALHLAQLYFQRRYAKGPHTAVRYCLQTDVRRYCYWRNAWIYECWSVALKIDAGAPKPTFFKVM